MLASTPSGVQNFVLQRTGMIHVLKDGEIDEDYRSEVEVILTTHNGHVVRATINLDVTSFGGKEIVFGDEGTWNFSSDTLPIEVQ